MFSFICFTCVKLLFYKKKYFLWEEENGCGGRMTLVPYHLVYFTLKRRGNGFFHVFSTWSTRGVFVGLRLSNAPEKTMTCSTHNKVFRCSRNIINLNYGQKKLNVNDLHFWIYLECLGFEISLSSLLFLQDTYKNLWETSDALG